MLETTIEAAPRGGAVEFTIRVVNRGDEDVELSFSDSQRVRVTAYDGDDPHWRSDEGQLFAQMLGSETVPAGEECVFEAIWDAPEPGEYRVVGDVLCQEEALRAETTVSV
jgi:hypothetical protein